MARRIPKLNIRFFKHLPPDQKQITLSTGLTLLRVILAPIIVISMIQGQWGAAFGLFIVASVTDLLDGSLARLLNQKTFLGACLDPIADKILLLSVFFTLAFVDTPLFTIPLWFVSCVLLRELLLVSGAVYMYFTKGHIEIQPTLLGKLTTFVQICFVVWLFACYFFQWMPTKTYATMLGVVLVMVFVSFVQYFRIGLHSQYLGKI